MPGNTVRVLFLGDVFGKPGRRFLLENLASFCEKENISFCIANCENAAGGNGLTPKIADQLFRAGVNVITMGDHVWDRSELEEYLDATQNILRPLNFPQACPGHGYIVLEPDTLPKIGVLNLIGRTFMKPADSPFTAAEKALEELKECPVIIVDFHAEATSEKVAMGQFLDGKVTAVLGTHTHIQTADAHILDGGTAYITDAGMTGPIDSIIGLKGEEIIQNYRLHLKRRFIPGQGPVRMEGVIVEINASTCRAEAILPVREEEHV